MDVPIIIVPYRNRRCHLNEWVVKIRALLTRNCIIVIAEQSRHGKFNRGAVLNAGFRRALQLKAQRVIFHDCDLIPDMGLARMYTEPWPSPIVHFGARFSRYNNTPRYFGGVVGFKVGSFPGFSNLFWGWGGEDDSLYRRVNEKDISRPCCGSYRDLERLPTVKEKLRVLKGHEKCMNKRELLREDDGQHDNHLTLEARVQYGRMLDCESILVTPRMSSKCRTGFRERRRREQSQ